MAWTETEISQFQIDNNKAIAEVNATLRPDVINPENRIGIFLPGQNGDVMSAASVLRYKNELWPNSEIIWFCNYPIADIFRYSCINEVRPWPWPGNGLELNSGGDFHPILNNGNNRLDVKKAKNYELTKDLVDGYFPAPWMIEPRFRSDIEYPDCSKMIFGVDKDKEWHPVLEFSMDDGIEVTDFICKLPQGKKRVLFETFGGSGQTILSEDMITEAMNICREVWDECVFIFCSHKYLRGNESFPDHFFDQQNIFSCSQFTVRQCALVSDCCDLIISVSSGITVACSSWGRFNVPIIQFCGSDICSTRKLAYGRRFELVTTDGKKTAEAKIDFYGTLKSVLN